MAQNMVNMEAQVQILLTSEQFIHCNVENNSKSFSAFVTMICAKNEARDRRSLWKELQKMESTINSEWVLCGNFNIILSYKDRISSLMDANETKDFRDVVDTLQLTALKI